MPPNQTPCPHTNLTLTPSPHILKTTSKVPSLAQKLAATTPSGIIPKNRLSPLKASIFPSPLLLPSDDLSSSPEPPQSFRSWKNEKHRNGVTPARKTIYLMSPPKLHRSVRGMKKWGEANGVGVKKGKGKVERPDIEVLRKYLEAFYWGMDVKIFQGGDGELEFTSDVEDPEYLPPYPNDEETEKSEKPVYLNTQTKKGCVHIRTRPTPYSSFSHQLNLNDLLDVAIEILPRDAYALLMVIEQDIYEDEEDDFTCGRAYGGSRVAVVSEARYNPLLDGIAGVEREHAWPASHCSAYIAKMCSEGEGKEEEDSIIEVDSKGNSLPPPTSPISQALKSHSLPTTSNHLTALWLSRLCRTSSHELGHCFGIAHCAYYACSMQGSASIQEDARQPPYLCPVDLEKVIFATGSGRRERYEILRAFCGGVEEGGFFGAFKGWIEARLEGLGEVDEV